MEASNKAEATPSDKRDKGRPLFVSVGIALFILGFIITVVFSAAGAMDGADSSSDGQGTADGRTLSTFENVMAFLGIFIGLLGVVTATVGPLTTVVVAKGRR